MDNLFISILIPTFNRSNKIIRLLNSLEKQTYKDFEIIIFNDQSTDDTMDVLNNFKANSNMRIKIIDSKEKRYKHGAMNVLFDECTTKYAFLIDDDDELVEKAIEEALNEFLTIPNNESYCAVVGRCLSSVDNKMIGKPYPNDINVRGWSKSRKIANKIKGEKFSLLNMEIYKKYKMPEPKGITFVSEYLLWNKALNNYQEFYTNNIWRIYHINEGECLSNQSLNYQYFKNRFFECTYFLNNFKNMYSNYKNLKFKTLIKLALIYLKINKLDKKLYKLNSFFNKIILFILWPIIVLGLIKYRK